MIFSTLRTLTACLMTLGFLASAAAEQGVTESSITLGMTAPFSGPNGAYGVAMQNAIQAYFSQVNKAGGVNGRKLELEALDDGYETDRAVANAKTLIKDKHVFALLASYGSSPTTEEMNQVFGPARVPLVGTISGAGTLRQPISDNPNSRYMFNVRASYADETELIVSHLMTSGVTRVAVFYQNDGFGKSGLDGVTQALAKHKLAPVALGTVERNSLDVASAVAAISKVMPQAVVMVTLYKPTAAFVKAMKQAKQNPILMTLSPVGTEQLVLELGEGARGITISQVVPHPLNNSVPVARDYQKMIKAEGKPPTYYGMEGYLMAKVMVEGIRRAGKEPTREKLITALEGMNHLDLGGFNVHYDATSRQASNFVEMTVIGPGGKVLR